jgi:hypothetical protein
MGWWGTGIMEGDSPMDEVGSLAAICEVEYSEEVSPTYGGDGDGYVFTPETLDKHQAEIAKVAENNSYDDHITYQVWAYLVMKNGAEMTAEMRGMFLSACDSDEWAQEGDEERQESVNDFRSKIEKYGGHPTNLNDHSKGLFHSLIEKGS